MTKPNRILFLYFFYSSFTNGEAHISQVITSLLRRFKALRLVFSLLMIQLTNPMGRVLRRFNTSSLQNCSSLRRLCSGP